MRENRLFSFEENLDENDERFSAYKAYTYTPGGVEREAGEIERKREWRVKENMLFKHSRMRKKSR